MNARPWGSEETLEQRTGSVFKRLIVQPGKRLSLQYHRHRAEYWVVVRGQGAAQIGEEQCAMQPGVSFYVPLGAVHRIENTHATAALEILEVQLGTALSEDDIVRLADDYGRAVTVTAERHA